MYETMRIYSYIFKNDYGFSPNPFWGVCTLSCCKPQIRKTAKEGDWVVGIRGKGLYKKMKLPKTTDPTQIYRIVYAMKITDVLSFDDYYSSFPEKRPDFERTEAIYRCGDNIYKPLGNGDYEQLQSQHKIKDKPKDLRGKFILISDNFYYFGSNPIEIPENLYNLICGRGHKCHSDKGLQSSFVDYISYNKLGVSAKPGLWKENDNSWDQ